MREVGVGRGMRGMLLGVVLLACGACERRPAYVGPRVGVEAGAVAVVVAAVDAGAVVADAATLPAEPGGRLAAPESVAVVAVTPYAAKVTWMAVSASVVGFEVEVNAEGAWKRAGLVDAKSRAFVHHLRLPGEAYEYRVRAFDARGTSDAVEARVTMPVAGAPPKVPPRGGCIPAVTAAPKATGGCSPDLDVIPATHPVTNTPSASDACRRRLLGEYQGCTRELGAFVLQADVMAVPGHETEGFPLLHAIEGAGQYVGAQILTLQFAAGRYVEVDRAQVCGDEPEDKPPGAGTVSADVTQSRPPFDACQFF